MTRLEYAFLPPCPCGKPWPDLTRFDPQTVRHVEDLVAELGADVTVTVNERSFLVPRRCIAYHGITGTQLLSGHSGFREVTA